jgi:hypothetical protein
MQVSARWRPTASVPQSRQRQKCLDHYLEREPLLRRDADPQSSPSETQPRPSPVVISNCGSPSIWLHRQQPHCCIHEARAVSATAIGAFETSAPGNNQAPHPRRSARARTKAGVDRRTVAHLVFARSATDAVNARQPGTTSSALRALEDARRHWSHACYDKSRSLTSCAMLLLDERLSHR